jgi:hypothetical protein
VVSILCEYKLARKTTNSMGFSFMYILDMIIRLLLGDRPFTYAHFDTHMWYIIMLKTITYRNLKNI